MFEKIIDFWYYHILNLKRYEKVLLKYQGYGERTILNFKKRNNIDWKIFKIILENLIIIDGLTLRRSLRNLIQNYTSLFNASNTYITHFGPLGKSSGVILNQFNRLYLFDENRIISNFEINQLPADANLIFLDDFIGTGQQALDYITSLKVTLNSSIKPYLFTVCATDLGIRRIQNAKTKFQVYSPIILRENEIFLLADTCNKLTDAQKRAINDINNFLIEPGQGVFNLNIPFCFFYTIPDNALPLLWNNDKIYNLRGENKIWYGLTPRDY